MAVKKSEKNNNGKYLEGVGRRKSSVARVRIYPETKQRQFLVNKKNLDDYCKTESLKEKILAPFEATGTKDAFHTTVTVAGGGKSGQADAIQLGLARALVKHDGEFQKPLRDLDYLKRDPRRKERKKPGLKKARRSPQWSKR